MPDPSSHAAEVIAEAVKRHRGDSLTLPEAIAEALDARGLLSVTAQPPAPEDSYEEAVSAVAAWLCDYSTEHEEGPDDWRAQAIDLLEAAESAEPRLAAPEDESQLTRGELERLLKLAEAQPAFEPSGLSPFLMIVSKLRAALAGPAAPSPDEDQVQLAPYDSFLYARYVMADGTEARLPADEFKELLRAISRLQGRELTPEEAAAVAGKPSKREEWCNCARHRGLRKLRRLAPVPSEGENGG